EELSISRKTSKELSTERSEIVIRDNDALRKKEFAENRIRELEGQHKEDLNSKDFTEFELNNQIVLLRQKVIDLETSLRNISKRRLNQSMGLNRSDNKTSEHVESNSSSDYAMLPITKEEKRPPKRIKSSKKVVMKLPASKFCSTKDPQQSIAILSKHWGKSSGEFSFLHKMHLAESLPKKLDYNSCLVINRFGEFYFCIPEPLEIRAENQGPLFSENQEKD
ncbi:4627_t:CDS:2, partial [Racocetra persica]